MVPRPTTFVLWWGVKTPHIVMSSENSLVSVLRRSQWRLAWSRKGKGMSLKTRGNPALELGREEYTCEFPFGRAESAEVCFPAILGNASFLIKIRAAVSSPQDTSPWPLSLSYFENEELGLPFPSVISALCKYSFFIFTDMLLSIWYRLLNNWTQILGHVGLCSGDDVGTVMYFLRGFLVSLLLWGNLELCHMCPGEAWRPSCGSLKGDFIKLQET